MSLAPVITIFVRHAAGCKYAGDEFSRRCDCRKHFRWTQAGKQYRKQAGTRSWTEAERLKHELLDQLSGRAPVEQIGGRPLVEAVKSFLTNKQVEGITPDVLGKYKRETGRLIDYCERHRVFTAQGLTRELLTGYAATWEAQYPSTQTRALVRTRCRGFLRYCYEAKWLDRIPALPKIKVDEVPTMPLSPEEYEKLLRAIDTTFPEPGRRVQVRALIQLMRWSGLAIRDALTLRRAALQADRTGNYRVVTKRQKTGVDVSVPLPERVAADILAAPNESSVYLFWDGETDIVKSWTKYIIAPLFKGAEVEKVGNMVSHRLRDTFAVDLLEKGLPMEELSKLLGHESIKTTEKSYAKWVKGRQDRLDALVRATWA